MDLPITSIVAKPSWKQVLIELVMTEKLDPWNIDIVVVADSFFNYIKKMEKFDFHIPANIILACAILLKYKSNAIRFYAEPQLAEAPPEEPAEGAIPELTLSWRIPPKRQITLNELMGEMERVIKYDSAERPKKVAAQMPTLELDLDNYDIESEIDKLYVRLKGGADSEGIVLFSSLINGGGAEEVVSAITPLLHLAQRKSICLRQDKFFGEIFINLSGDETNGKEGNGMAETGAASHREAMRKEGNGKNAEADSLPEPEDAELEAGEAEMGSGAEGEGAGKGRPGTPATQPVN